MQLLYLSCSYIGFLCPILYDGQFKFISAVYMPVFHSANLLSYVNGYLNTRKSTKCPAFMELICWLLSYPVPAYSLNTGDQQHPALRSWVSINGRSLALTSRLVYSGDLIVTGPLVSLHIYTNKVKRMSRLILVTSPKVCDWPENH